MYVLDLVRCDVYYFLPGMAHYCVDFSVVLPAFLGAVVCEKATWTSESTIIAALHQSALSIQSATGGTNPSKVACRGWPNFGHHLRVVLVCIAFAVCTMKDLGKVLDVPLHLKIHPEEAMASHSLNHKVRAPQGRGPKAAGTFVFVIAWCWNMPPPLLQPTKNVFRNENEVPGGLFDAQTHSHAYALVLGI